MDQTARLMLEILKRITTAREAVLVWAVAGGIILVFLYVNDRTA